MPALVATAGVQDMAKQYYPVLRNAGSKLPYLQQQQQQYTGERMSTEWRSRTWTGMRLHEKRLATEIC